MDSIPGLGRFPGGGHGNLPQYSGLEKSMNRETWRATVHRGSKSPTFSMLTKIHIERYRASLVTQMGKNLPTMLETWYQSLG